MASPPSDVTVTTADNNVTVTWAGDGNMVTGYRVYYNHPDHNVTIVNITSNSQSHTFIERTVSQYVFAVAVQALSRQIPNVIVGPITVRGQLLKPQLVFYVSQLCMTYNYGAWFI